VVAVELADCAAVAIADVAITGAEVGVRSYLVDGLRIERLAVDASQTGWDWTGDWSTAFQWQDVSLTAPTPLVGSSVRGLPVTGAAPDWDVYPQLPSADAETADD